MMWQDARTRRPGVALGDDRFRHAVNGCVRVAVVAVRCGREATGDSNGGFEARPQARRPGVPHAAARSATGQHRCKFTGARAMINGT